MIVDIAAIAVVLFFSALIFLLPQISQDIMKEFCFLDSIMKTTKCDAGKFLFYLIPAIPGLWILVRFFNLLFELMR
jgi:hypothetical protein